MLVIFICMTWLQINYRFPLPFILRRMFKLVIDLCGCKGQVSNLKSLYHKNNGGNKIEKVEMKLPENKGSLKCNNKQNIVITLTLLIKPSNISRIP